MKEQIIKLTRPHWAKYKKMAKIVLYNIYYILSFVKSNFWNKGVAIPITMCPLFNVPSVSEAWQERMSHNPPSSLRVKYTFTCILLSCPFSGYNLTELPVQKVVLAVTSA